MSTCKSQFRKPHFSFLKSRAVVLKKKISLNWKHRCFRKIEKKEGFFRNYLTPLWILFQQEQGDLLSRGTSKYSARQSRDFILSWAKITFIDPLSTVLWKTICPFFFVQSELPWRHIRSLKPKIVSFCFWKRILYFEIIILSDVSY